MNAHERLRAQFGDRLCTAYPLAGATSFRIGGPADFFLIVETVEELCRAKAIAAAHSMPAFCLGAGTNLLISDRGIRGLVLKLGAAFSQIAIDGLSVRAGASAQFADLAEATVEQGLAGLEYGEGIPGSVGGGLVMNAGAFGGEIARVVAAVHGADAGGVERRLTADEIGFAYRRTALPEGFIITRVDFALETGDRAVLRERVLEIRARRAARQPRNAPNAGSVFRNPPGSFAGKLLEEAGMKGARVGAAAFSERHANFIVNLGGARASEVRDLMELARQRVRARAGVSLEPEMRLVGEW